MTKLYLLIAFVAFGCGRTALPYEDGTPSGAGVTAQDLAPPIHVTPPDMAEAGDSCGQIVTCLVTCGMQGQACIQGCFSNVQGQALGEAGGVLFCAAQNCLTDITGGNVNPIQLFLCMSQSCSTQLSQCSGLSFPGLGGGPPN